MIEYFTPNEQDLKDWEASIQQQIDYIEWIKQKMFNALAVKKLEPNNRDICSLYPKTENYMKLLYDERNNNI